MQGGQQQGTRIIHAGVDVEDDRRTRKQSSWRLTPEQFVLSTEAAFHGTVGNL